MHAPPLGCHLIAQPQKQCVFQILGLFIGRQDFFLVFLQFRRNIPLGVFDRLLANILGRNFLAVGIGDFDVVTEYLIEPDFQVWNAAALRLLGLIAGNPLLAAVGQFAQRIQVGVEAVADESAVAA